VLDDAALRNALERHWEFSGRDEDAAHEIYHDDAVLEFPQSGERFEGVENMREWRRLYPADIAFDVRRINRGGDLVVTEYAISYDGAPWMPCVNVMDFRGDRVAREHIYIMETWEAAEWRAPWWAAPAGAERRRAGEPAPIGPEPSPEGSAVTDDAVVRALVDRYFGETDMDRAHEIYHDDAVLEFPQSGERFEGVENMREWRRLYPAQVDYRFRRISHGGDLAVLELTVAYDGGPEMLGIGIWSLRAGKVAREHVYVMDRWEAAEWRAPWRAEPPDVDDAGGI
jgi:ketosteroid isomerase-like protein